MSEDPRQTSYANGTPMTVAVIFHHDLTVLANVVILPSVFMGCVDSRYGCYELLDWLVCIP